jgi:hypothetical protein
MGWVLVSGRCRGRMGPGSRRLCPNFPQPLVGSLLCPLDRSGLCSDSNADLETIRRLSDPASSQNGRFSPSFAGRVTPSGTVSDDVGSALRAHASGQGECTSSQWRGMTGYCKLYGYLSSNPGWPTPGLSARV